MSRRSYERRIADAARSRRARLVALVALLSGASGCTTLDDGSRWGEDATLFPSLAVLERAAVDAATDPWTWAPLAAAALFAIDDWDEEASDWARFETPIFGSTESAADASDDLRSAAYTAMLATSLATASGEAPLEWTLAKGKGLLVEAGARSMAGFVTDGLKRGVGRERPNGEDDRSMCSGHTSSAAASAFLARRNLDSIPWIPDGARQPAHVLVRALPLATGWARVEAGEHYPSDVLVGAAVGNFFARFVHDAFLGLPDSTWLEVSIDPSERSLLIGITWVR